MKWLAIAFTTAVFLNPCYSFPQAADGFMTRETTDQLRTKLAPPTLWWEEIRASIGRTNMPMGYSSDEMLGYPDNEHKLQSVKNLFRDILSPSRYSGLLSDNMLLMADRPAELAYVLWSQLGAYAGREWVVPKEIGDWGVAWIPKGTDTPKALQLALKHQSSNLTRNPKSAASNPNITAKLPASVQKFLTRLIIGEHLSRPFLQASYSRTFESQAQQKDGNQRSALYDLLQSPYLGDVNDDTITIFDRRAYDAMREIDFNYSAYGAVLFLRHFDAALAELKANGIENLRSTRFETIDLITNLGWIRISDGSSGVFGTPGCALHVDLGGDDQYSFAGTPTTVWIAQGTVIDEPLSVLVDLAGDDRYNSEQVDGSTAAGFLGIGMIYDESGNDAYLVRNGGLGFALYGTGLLIDNSGDDRYVAKQGWAMGAAYAGVGLLLDRSGNDTYNAVNMCMGFGGTKGIGALVDLKGNDRYKTNDTGNHSKVWGKTVSMSMGCGYGRRCDSGDGQNQGGGIGLLVDGDGDDSYYSGVFSMGSGYWWGAGLFEDRNGNDTYRATNYSFGSGAHFAIGSFVDVHGNDHYNTGANDGDAFACVGRDGSMASCIDGDGDDIWNARTYGWTNLNSYSLFWDRKGADTYLFAPSSDPASKPVSTFGTSAIFPLQRNFRDEKLSVAIFLDTQGKDSYPAGLGAKENETWQLQTGPVFWGYGRDGEVAEP